jgi:hypothetical protein
LNFRQVGRYSHHYGEIKHFDEDKICENLPRILDKLKCAKKFREPYRKEMAWIVPEYKEGAE